MNGADQVGRADAGLEIAAVTVPIAVGVVDSALSGIAAGQTAAQCISDRLHIALAHLGQGNAAQACAHQAAVVVGNALAGGAVVDAGSAALPSITPRLSGAAISTPSRSV